MRRGWNSRRFGGLGRAAMLAVSLAFALDGCAAAMHGRSSGSPPSQADSMMAQFRLVEVVEEHWQFLEKSRPELAARADVTVTRLPDPSIEKVKWDAQVSRAGLAALDEVDIDALAEDSYVTWLTLEWDLSNMAGRVA